MSLSVASVNLLFFFRRPEAAIPPKGRPASAAQYRCLEQISDRIDFFLRELEAKGGGGGQSGGTAGAGGAAGDGIGDVKYSGGDGATGANNGSGGGAAGPRQRVTNLPKLCARGKLTLTLNPKP